MDDPFVTDIHAGKKLTEVTCDLGTVRIGDRVILRPLGRADIFDIALSGMRATVVSIEQDYENRIHVAVVVDDDPGKDFGHAGKPGHRFFFGIDEVEPVSSDQGAIHEKQLKP